MRLHTNTLEWKDLYTALNAAQATGSVAKHVAFEVSSEHNSRSHSRAFEIQLGTDLKVPGDKRRFKNSGQYGASTVYAATRDEWGYFIAELYKRDPEAVFGPYKGLKDFDSATGFKYTD